MKKLFYLLLFGALCQPMHQLRAQEKPKTEERVKVPTPIKVQIVFTEFEDDKKVASMPYAFTVISDSSNRHPRSHRDGRQRPENHIPGYRLEHRLRHQDRRRRPLSRLSNLRTFRSLPQQIHRRRETGDQSGWKSARSDISGLGESDLERWANLGESLVHRSTQRPHAARLRDHQRAEVIRTLSNSSEAPLPVPKPNPRAKTDNLVFQSLLARRAGWITTARPPFHPAPAAAQTREQGTAPADASPAPAHM